MFGACNNLGSGDFQNDCNATRERATSWSYEHVSYLVRTSIFTLLSTSTDAPGRRWGEGQAGVGGRHAARQRQRRWALPQSATNTAATSAGNGAAYPSPRATNHSKMHPASTPHYCHAGSAVPWSGGVTSFSCGIGVMHHHHGRQPQQQHHGRDDGVHRDALFPRFWTGRQHATTAAVARRQ